MKIKDILAVSGQPGLYKFIAQSSNGVIVEALSDNRRSNVTGHTKLSSLAEIAIYTEGEDIPLWQVFSKMYEKTNGKAAISHKSDTRELAAFFEEVLNDYDRDRVHVSDIKKAIQWFNLLVEAGMSDFTVEEAKEESESEKGKDKKE